MGQNLEEHAELTSLNIIRAETALSRYPIHRLAKRGTLNIELRKTNERGELVFKWEVSYNIRHGQPGPLAYKLDTVIINRRIEEEGKPLPKIIKLGSLREVCRELEVNEGQATKNVKQALYQNASAFITAKLTYKGKDGSERKFEFGDTRYGVVFTGEDLPDGQKADAVYIVLHDIYRELLNAAPTRPLDYDYIKKLPPAAQRLYELLSFQVFAALKNGRPRARYLYSEYCTYAPQIRYFDFDRVKKQMYKVHAAHRKAGYISKTEFEETIDPKGKPDWVMYYTPGPKARREFKAFTSKREPLFTKAEREEPQRESDKKPEITAATTTEEAALVAELRKHHIAEATARELARDFRKSVELQLSALPYRDRSNVRNLPSWLIKAIRENYELPEAVVKMKAKAEEVQQEKAKRAYQEARQNHELRFRVTFSEYVTRRISEIKECHPESYRAFEEATAEERRKTFKVIGPESHIGQATFEAMICEYFHDHPEHPILDFWQWDAQLNPEPFKYDS
jgi:hypothetical protein